MMPLTKTLLAAAAAILSVSAADAATVNVGGTVLYGMYAPITTESVPGQTFTFSFITQDPIPGNPDTALINPMFSLAGVVIAPPTAVQFFSNADGGLFDLIFSDNVISLAGESINANGHLQSGFYAANVYVGANSSNIVGGGGVTVSVSVSPVPLPASAPLFGGGLLALAATGIAFKRGQRTQAAA